MHRPTSKVGLKIRRRSCVTTGYSFLLFILGFFSLIQKTSRSMRIGVFVSCASLATFVAKSPSPRFCIVYIHSGVHRHALAYRLPSSILFIIFFYADIWRVCPIRQYIHLRKYYKRPGISYLSSCKCPLCKTAS